MLLNELLSNIPHEIVKGNDKAEISGISLNSRQIKPGFVFVAKKGAVADGNFYIEDAAERGAAAVFVTEVPKLIPENLTVVKLSQDEDTLSLLAHRFYGQPKCKLIGVTGTNGKTTSAYVIRNFLSTAGLTVGLIGTISYEIKDRKKPASRTTPDVFELYALLSTMDKEGADAVVMEVSSHAAVQKRIGNLLFDYLIFTNLTQDHLDYHHSMEEYYGAKRRFFDHAKEDSLSLVMIDDEWGERLAKELREVGQKVVTMTTTGKDADVKAENIKVKRDGSEFTLEEKGQAKKEVKINFLGRHNVANVMGAVILASNFGIPEEKILSLCPNLPPVPGRLEFMPNKLGVVIVIDYAHTDDAMRNVMKCLREITDNSLWIVFGCGGDRDKGKRPKMGRAAEEMADKVVITTDNPRTEDPEAIVKDITDGMKLKKHVVILDRKEAIEHAVKEAKEGDVVLIAGKGHETYQEINRVFYDCDERMITKEIISKIENA